MQTRYVMKILSPTSHSSKQEYSTEGGPWLTYREGKTTKTP